MAIRYYAPYVMAVWHIDLQPRVESWLERAIEADMGIMVAKYRTSQTSKKTNHLCRCDNDGPGLDQLTGLFTATDVQTMGLCVTAIYE